MNGGEDRRGWASSTGFLGTTAVNPKAQDWAKNNYPLNLDYASPSGGGLLVLSTEEEQLIYLPDPLHLQQVALPHDLVVDCFSGSQCHVQGYRPCSGFDYIRTLDRWRVGMLGINKQ